MENARTPSGERYSETGERTYAQAVARGMYARAREGLAGKHDNVRTCWEDEVTRAVLRPHVRKRVQATRAARRGLRILDLGCGAGEGYELLTGIRQSDRNLEATQRYVLEPAGVELYLGVDLSLSMLEQGRQNYHAVPPVRFCRVDLRDGLGEADREAPFDVYFSSYGSLSHLDAQQLRSCLGAVARHAAPGSLIVLDLMGRYSPEWPHYWAARTEEEKIRPYSMSYLLPEQERGRGPIEWFSLRFWTGEEVRALLEEVAGDAGVELGALEVLDRSIFVGRHVDTREYGTSLPPLRSQVNRLFEHNTRTSLDEVHAAYDPVPGADWQNAFFQRLVDAWNTVVEFAHARLAGERVDLVTMEGWRTFPTPLQMALMTVDRIMDGVAWIDVGDVRANVIEPQLAYVLRRMQCALQQGRGCGHGLVAVAQVG